MSKITRITQKLFGSTAGSDQIAQFGSLAAGSPQFTNNPATIQALSNYLEGWFAAVVDVNAPTIEDMNALFFLYSYQLGYILQQGIPEYDASTTYYQYSIVQNAGVLYQSKGSAALIGQTPPNGSFWQVLVSNQITTQGDLIYGGSAGVPSRLGIGSTGTVLTASAGLPVWSNPAFVSPLTTLGDLIYGGASGSATRLPGNTTVLNKVLTQQGTGSTSAVPVWSSLSSAFTAPTVQKFTTGSGTYTTPAGVLYIKVKAVGGGGGGGGSGTGSNGAGGSGSATTFGSSLLVANGGLGGSGSTGNGGTGGSASLGSGPVGVAIAGGSGSGGASANITTVGAEGGSGASSALGGGGGGGADNVNGGTATGGAASTNSGSGGGGAGGTGSVSGLQTGGGGGAGGWVDAIITSPASTYPYGLGGGGAAGVAGTSGAAGGAGAAGILVVEEFYQ